MIKILQWNQARCLCYVYEKDEAGNYIDLSLMLVDTNYLLNLEAAGTIVIRDYPLLNQQKRGE